MTTIDLSAVGIAQGYAIFGETGAAWDGHFVSSAGDMNGDGYADIILGVFYAERFYVVYGSSSNPGTIFLSTALNKTQGFAVLGATGTFSNAFGFSVSTAGDFNGDGYADVIIGAPYASPSSRFHAGECYVIFGSRDNPGTIDLSDELVSTQGFTILGEVASNYIGHAVSTAGDINGDGFADIVVIVQYAISRVDAGAAYVIYGSSSHRGTIDLSTGLTDTQGFAVMGRSSYYGDWSVSTAGDFNNDGYSDIIIGAAYASPSGRQNAGESYVIYGSRDNPGTIDLSLAFTNTQGFVISGGSAGDCAGYSVSTAGDVNNDGFADIIIGAHGADPDSRVQAGGAVVIYGSSGNPGTIDLSVALHSTQGFAIHGAASGDESGRAVGTAGDFNNDGYADLIIGAEYASLSSRPYAGISYVIYGSGWNPGTLDLSIGLTSAQGITVLGAAEYDHSGVAVGTTGDVNNDGYADIIIATTYAPTGTAEYFILYGYSEPTVSSTLSPLPTLSPTARPTARTTEPTVSSTLSPLPTLSPTARLTVAVPARTTAEISFGAIIGIALGGLVLLTACGYVLWTRLSSIWSFPRRPGAVINDISPVDNISNTALSSYQKHPVSTFESNALEPSAPPYAAVLTVGIVLDAGWNNNFLDGVLPPCVWYDVSNIDASNNFFTSTVPTEYANMRFLESLNIESNDLTGTIPNFFYDLTGLLSLCIGSNQLVGDLSTEILNINSLVELDFSYLYLSGEDINYS
jgi:hypothetical protein